MEDLSLHILDIVENSLAAGAKQVEIRIIEDLKEDKLTIEIIDDGQGMSKEVQERALDPFFTTKTTRRVGLGLPFFQECCQVCNGQFFLESQPGKGTRIKAVLPYHHIDRKPLGNMAETLITLIVGHPKVEIIFEHKRNGVCFAFNTKEIKTILEDLPLNDPQVVSFLRSYISSQIEELGLHRETL